MKFSTLSKITAAIIVATSLTACMDDGDDGVDGAAGVAGAAGAAGADGQNGVSNFVTRDDVIKTNANIAYAAYSDSVISAQALKSSVQALVANPSAETFANAKQAWLDSREPYGQTEVYRFRQGPIDELKADGSLGTEGEGPEGRINAWPLGEALIDYTVEVDGVVGDGLGEGMNIISDTVNYPVINAETLNDLFEYGEDEANVTTGYHAIEFLLWGQDLNQDQSGAGDRDSSAGQRPWSDYQVGTNSDGVTCTSGTAAAMDDICTRRGQYLVATADLLIEELSKVAAQWEPVSGPHYNNFVAGGDTSLAKILEGMGRLSFGELAGERMNIALIEDSQEDEHSCFSDNTHRDIFLNAKGVQNSFNAQYTRIDGEVVEGASIYDLLVVEDQHELANQLRGSLEATMAAATVIDTKAKTGMPFDVLIQQGIDQENVKNVINALAAQTDDIELVIDALNVTTNDLRGDTEQDI